MTKENNMSNAVVMPKGFKAPVKLGRAGVKHDPRTLSIAKYLPLGSITRGLPTPPTSRHWGRSRTESWGMLGNDRFGDCTCAGAIHQMQTWLAADEHQQTVFTEDDALQAYHDVTGFTPNNPASDEGAYLLDVLNYWRKHGIGRTPDRKIMAFAQLNPQNVNEVKTCIDIFGGVYMGVNLPESAASQTTWKAAPWYLEWESKYRPGSWGGHCVNFVGYDSKYVELVTWGAVIKATWAFVKHYFDEGYAIISQDWLGSDQKTPGGFDLNALQADLATVTA
jgi:hypothetical protein